MTTFSGRITRLTGLLHPPRLQLPRKQAILAPPALRLKKHTNLRAFSILVKSAQDS